MDHFRYNITEKTLVSVLYIYAFFGSFLEPF